MKIKDVKAREILDSRGNPTVEVDIHLYSGIIGRAAVPSGASTGKREALELRDLDRKGRYGGKGVKLAVKNVNTIIKNSIKGLNIDDQVGIDKCLIKLDGTENKSKLGANAILGVSMAVARASANNLGIPLFKYIGGIRAKKLPMPMMNIINGGVHANNNLDIQEFMIIPKSAKSFSEALQIGVMVFNSLKKKLIDMGLSISVGDEGGFTPCLNANEDAFALIMDAINESGYIPGEDVALAIDVAASEFFDGEKYIFKSENKRMNSNEVIDYYKYLIDKYPIISIEDGLSEQDWNGWISMTKKLKDIVQIVGDDIFVTNSKVFSEGINLGIGNSILIKLNQIGTLTETIETISIAKSKGYSTIISHRSGETEDTFISDLAVGTNSGQIKTGSLSRSERVAKYNQLLRIEEELGVSAHFPTNL